MKPAIALYVSLYKQGLRTLEQVPTQYRAEVEAALRAEGYIF